jgi:hypothetical protein
MALQSTTSRQHSHGDAVGPQAGERLGPVRVPAGEDRPGPPTRERTEGDVGDPGPVSTAKRTSTERESTAQEPSSAAGGERAPAHVPTAEHSRPAADGTQPPPVTPAQRRQPPQEHVPVPASAQQQRRRRGAANRRPSGRERHDEKITVYVSAEELMDLEHARLVLRGEHGLAVDRGRIVREAVAVVLADLESRGEASILVRRLRGR